MVFQCILHASTVIRLFSHPSCRVSLTTASTVHNHHHDLWVKKRLMNGRPLRLPVCLSVWSRCDYCLRPRRDFNWMSQLVSFFLFFFYTFAKGQFLKSTIAQKDTQFEAKPPAHPEIDRIVKNKKDEYFLTGRIFFRSIRSHFCFVSTTQYPFQPSKSTPNFHFPAEQTVLSFHPFSSRPFVSVIALFPGIERSCHRLSKSRWLEHPSGDRSNVQTLSGTFWELVHTLLLYLFKKNYY